MNRKARHGDERADSLDDTLSRNFSRGGIQSCPSTGYSCEGKALPVFAEPTGGRVTEKGETVCANDCWPPLPWLG